MVNAQSSGAFAHLVSQTQLSQRIVNLLRFRSSFVHVYGEVGSGKSTCATLVLEQADFADHALLKVNAASSNETLRRDLLLQLLSEPLFDAADHLLESWQRNSAFNDGSWLVVLDDADKVSETFLAELLQLQQFIVGQGGKLSVVCTYSEKRFEQQIPRSFAAVSMTLRPLSQAESTQLASTLFKRTGYHINSANQGPIEQHIQAAKGNPSHIHKYVDEIVRGERPVIETQKKRKIGWPMMLAGLLTILVLVLIVQVILNPQVEDETLSAQQDELLNIIDTTRSASEQRAELSQAQLEQGSLPEPMASETVSINTTRNENEMRVVVEDDVVERLMAQAQENNDLSLTEPAISSVPANTATTETPQPEKSKESVANVVEPKPSTQENDRITTVIEPKAKATSVNTQLLNKPAKHYTLQLIALSSEESAQKFVKAKQWQHPVWIYRSLTNPKSAYRVIYGEFASRSAADSARNALKQQGQDSLPKLFEQVQFEISQQ